jgi:hypothetical protein
MHVLHTGDYPYTRKGNTVRRGGGQVRTISEEQIWEIRHTVHEAMFVDPINSMLDHIGIRSNNITVGTNQIVHTLNKYTSCMYIMH